jgi:hypothetical protein
MATAAAAAVAVVDLGDPVTVTVPFTVGGVATTPTAAAWTVWPPADAGLAPLAYTYPGAETTVPATGTLRLTIPAAAITASGLWRGKVVTTGAAAAGESFRFFVRPDPA